MLVDAPEKVRVPAPDLVTPNAAEITPDMTPVFDADTPTVALSLSVTSPESVADDVNDTAPALETPLPRIRSGSAIEVLSPPAISSVAPSDTMV